MTDTNKFRQGEVPPEQEDALENVAGGTNFSRPNYESPDVSMYRCPVCGATVKDNHLNHSQLKCNGCGRRFHLNGSTLVEE